MGQCLGASTPIQGRSCEVAGLRFANPIGLAAGLDKNAVAVSGFSRLGFGHIEVGTVTPRAQPGNPKPRVFRLERDRGLINRFGFNNDGIDALVARLTNHPYAGIIGVNIGKNKNTPNETAHEDYVHCLQKAAAVSDYITINVSSPNTPGLRDLADADKILDVVAPVLEARAGLQKVLEALKLSAADGVILTNTTIRREGSSGRHQAEVGGLSGAPLSMQSEHCLQVAVAALEGALPVISVGGVMSGDDAQRRLELGASLVQIYTGLIYRGPQLVKDAIRVTR